MSNKTMKVKCAVCGKMFAPTANGQKYCSQKCYKTAKAARRKAAKKAVKSGAKPCAKVEKKTDAKKEETKDAKKSVSSVVSVNIKKTECDRSAFCLFVKMINSVIDFAKVIGINR